MVLFFYWFYEFTILLNFYSTEIGEPLWLKALEFFLNSPVGDESMLLLFVPKKGAGELIPSPKELAPMYD